MRCAYISLAAASLCWSGALALGARHASDGVHGHKLRGAMMADQGQRGRVVMGEMDRTSTPQRKKNGTEISGGYHQLDLRQAGGQCGAQYGRCPGDLCCSDYGYCGDSVDHCAPLFDCQPQYGTCGWPRAPPAPSTTSTTSAPPPPPTTTSTTSTTSAPPPPPTTTSTTSTSAPPPPPTTTTTTSRSPTSTTSQLPPTQTPTIPGGRITTNGQCGNGTSCIGNPSYGPCCSQFFWCGSALDFCGAGCRSEFGACLGVPGQPPIPASNVTSIPGSTTSTTSAPPPPVTTSTTSTTTSAPPPPVTTTSTTSSRTTSTSAAPPTPTVVIPPGFRSSTDGSCGPGVTCLGSTYGRCCSQFGYCGDSDQFCPYIVGCQPEYGYCDPQP